MKEKNNYATIEKITFGGVKMFKSKLRYLMADKQINSVKKLIDETGLSRTTLNKLYHSENLETLSLNMLGTLCKYFDCSLTELVEYIPD